MTMSRMQCTCKSCLLIIPQFFNLPLILTALHDHAHNKMIFLHWKSDQVSLKYRIVPNIGVPLIETSKPPIASGAYCNEGLK